MGICRRRLFEAYHEALAAAKAATEGANALTDELGMTRSAQGALACI